MFKQTLTPQSNPHTQRPFSQRLRHPFPDLRRRLKETHLHDVKVKAVHTKHSLGKFANLANKNHRHDEEHEKRTDEKRTAIAESHRFGSFAPDREGNDAKWYVDGRDYFWAVSVALEKAQKVIYIADWWLSPELYLRRPPSSNQRWRLDEVLKRRAEAGVKIFIIVYKEVPQALTINSDHTQEALRKLCKDGSPGHGNIKCIRHPDHNVFENAGDMTFYWAHHEKFVVIDYELAFIGGLDLCFGRWDLPQHPLADYHPSGAEHQIFPGQDFNNNRVLDFQNLEEWEKNDLSRSEHGRMPWHDISICITGPCVYDIAEHFILRWNFCKRDKYKRDARYPWLELEGRDGEDEDLIGVQRPKYPVGGYIRHPVEPDSLDRLDDRGGVRAQLVRSSADWSSGILNEHSIETAYIEVIRNAQHFVYIENQFFITATGEEQSPIHNQIGGAIVEACVRAANEKRKFRVIILIPAIPGFAGDLRDDAATGTRAIMDYQYKSILRGEHSIMARIRAQGVDPAKHIFIFNLRAFDRLNVSKKKQSSDKESKDGKQQSSEEDNARVESARRPPQGEPPGDDSIAYTTMLGDPKVSEGPSIDGDGVDHAELENFVQEELYIHAKLCIVDDRVVICGSSNINDRSMIGFHDSELSIVIEDTATISSKMDGKPYEAARFAATLRRRLWREHLGLLPPQAFDATDDPAAQPLSGEKQAEESPSDAESARSAPSTDSEDAFVADPLGEEVWKRWTENATVNTEVFRSVFHADPDDHVRTMEDYDRFLPRDGAGQRKSGHVFDSFRPVGEVRRQLDRVKGHLVWMPLDFLCEAEMAEKGLQVNAYTESIFT